MHSFEEIMNPLSIRPAPARIGRTTLLSMLLVGACALGVATPANAELYKWTDDRGVIHYSDQMPAEAVNRASQQMSRQGLTIRKVEQARAVTQPVARTASDEQRERQAQRDMLLATRRDRALVESFTSESEIELAKGRAVATIEGQMQSAEAYIATMQKRRLELEAKKGTYAPRPVPGGLVLEAESLDGEIARQHALVAAKQREAAAVAARYEADRRRFRELRGEPSGSIVTTDDRRFSAVEPGAMQLTAGSPAGH